MGSASGASRMKSRLRHLFNRLADGLLAGLLGGDHEGQIVLGVAGLLQHRFQADMFAGQNARQLGDDSRAVLHAEAQVVGALLQLHRDRLVLAQPLVRERRDALRTAAANLARHAHQVADHGDAGGMPRAPPVVEGVLAEHALHPHRVVRTLHAGQNRGGGNQRRAHEQNQPVRRLAPAADQPDGVLQRLGVLEIERRDAADAFHEDVRRA